MLWGGYLLSILPALLLFFSAAMKLLKNPQAIQGFAQLGYPAHAATSIGILEAACTVLYLIPRTSVLGAILLAGYMGGATATHLRVGEPFFVQVLVGVLLWGGLYLRDERLRALLPLRS
ncbi:MAG: DoxX family protein [Acidobacteria bacterium]|nr:DoxX family protein [Acidobacteriota bacterium]MBI3423851.1 DoxX family protein [Acidobacteriota bacterium]